VRLPRDWANTETLVLLAVLLAFAVGSTFGAVVLTQLETVFAVDNRVVEP
jgi:hypothetical protein